MFIPSVFLISFLISLYVYFHFLFLLGEERNWFKILVRKPERKSSIQRARRTRENNLRIDLKRGCEVCLFIQVGTGASG
jgi:hypothetical protein